MSGRVQQRRPRPPSPAHPAPPARPHLEVPVVVLAQQLQEAQDGLHDGDDRAHLQVILGLVRRGLGALAGLVVVVGVGLPPEGGEGLPGGGGGLQQLVADLLRYLCHGLFGWKTSTRPSSPRDLASAGRRLKATSRNVRPRSPEGSPWLAEHSRKPAPSPLPRAGFRLRQGPPARSGLCCVLEEKPQGRLCHPARLGSGPQLPHLRSGDTCEFHPDRVLRGSM